MNAAQAWKELEPFHPAYVFAAVGSCFVALTRPNLLQPHQPLIEVQLRHVDEVMRQELKW